jgi:hypothetical protein
MYALAWKSEHIVWKNWWYTFMLGVSLWADLYMICEDQIFVVNVVVVDLTQNLVITNVISWLKGAIAELSAIAKILQV